MPCENSNDTSMLIQSLDSLRTRTSQHGHLLANWYHCHAGKVCAPGKIVANLQCRPSGGNGQRVRSASQRCAQTPSAGVWLGNFILITDLIMWTLAIRDFSVFFVFHSLSATGQVMHSMWLNGHNPAGRSKEGRGTHFPGNLGMVTWAHDDSGNRIQREF